MELIVADSKGYDIRRLAYDTADFDLFETLDFEIVISVSDWMNDISYGTIIYEPNTECGGIVGEIETNTAEQTITVRGYTWRGYLEKRIIEPPSGSAYLKDAGEANRIIRDRIDNQYNGIIKGSKKNSGYMISTYSFNRYTTIRLGLTKMLLTQNLRLEIRYVQGEAGAVGYAEVSAVPIVDYSGEIELSQDNKLNFIMNIKNNCVNHLIVLGEGELTERNVLHLYLQRNGTIGKTQYHKGIDEIAETYENTNSEDLEEDGIKHFEELISSSSFSMDVESLNLNVGIGDILGGRDYITQNVIKKVLAGKIITFNGEKSVEYRLEE